MSKKKWLMLSAVLLGAGFSWAEREKIRLELEAFKDWAERAKNDAKH
jgi:hypothetical protein